MHCPPSLSRFTYTFLLLLGSCLDHPHIFSLPKEILPIFNNLVKAIFLYETKIDQLNPQ